MFRRRIPQDRCKDFNGIWNGKQCVDNSWGQGVIAVWEPKRKINFKVDRWGKPIKQASINDWIFGRRRKRSRKVRRRRSRSKVRRRRSRSKVRRSKRRSKKL
jgi:hypothetical protein